MSFNNTALFHSAHWFSCACNPSLWNLGTIMAKCPVCTVTQHYSNLPAMLHLADRVARDGDRRDWLESYEVLSTVTRASEDAFPKVINRLPSWVEALWSVPSFRDAPCSMLNMVRLAFSHPTTAFVGALFHGPRTVEEMEHWIDDPMKGVATEVNDPVTPSVSLVVGESVEDMLRFASIDPDAATGLIYDLRRGKLSALSRSTTLEDVEG